MITLYNRYVFFEDGRILDSKENSFLKNRKIIYLMDGLKRRNFRFLKKYFELFSGEKLPRNKIVRLKEGLPLSLENLDVLSSRGRPFNPLNEEEVVSMYKNGGKLREIAYTFNTRTSVIAAILKDKGINPSPKNCFRVPYKVNHSYFSSIDSYEKAYLLGVLFADGCVMMKSNQINLISNDYDLLEFFKREIGFSGEIQQNPLHKNAKFVAFSSIEMKQDLIKLGCVPRKSLTLEFPNIEEKYFWTFLLGYFDGDGSLWVAKSGSQAHFKVMSSTKFCLKLQNLLDTKGFKSEVRNEPKRYKKETSYIRISSKGSIRKIFPLLYENAPFFLRRKRDKFLELL